MNSKKERLNSILALDEKLIKLKDFKEEIERIITNQNKTCLLNLNDIDD